MMANDGKFSENDMEKTLFDLRYLNNKKKQKRNRLKMYFCYSQANTERSFAIYNSGRMGFRL